MNLKSKKKLLIIDLTISQTIIKKYLFYQCYEIGPYYSVLFSEIPASTRMLNIRIRGCRVISIHIYRGLKWDI